MAETANPALDREIDELVDLSSLTNEPILLLGETGTGKTEVANRIHSLWSKSMKKGDDSPFTDVNCAGLDTGMLESELFGHVKGAFTGAVRTKMGKLEVANGGTLFLDEIGDMSLKVQGSLLKAHRLGICHGLAHQRFLDFGLGLLGAGDLSSDSPAPSIGR